MVDENGQAGATHSEILKEAISEAVLDWFGDSGDFGVHCDAATASAVASDALALFEAKKQQFFSSIQLLSHQAL